MSAAGRPCGPPGMQAPDCGPPGNGSAGWRPCGPPGMQAPDCGPPGNGSAGWRPSTPAATSTYVVNSKIMVVAVVVLFAVVVFILCLHVYAKWFWRTRAVAQQQQPPDELGSQARRMGSWRRRGRADARVRAPSAPLVVVQSVGLEKAAIESLPTFEFEGKTPLECAVCLEDFEPGEMGRTLPKCAHHFHLDCVDMWLHSHSTCPLCRASARPDESKPVADPLPVVVPIDDQPQLAPVIGDVQAPFMAAMRASRRQRQRSRGSFQLPTSPISQLPDLNENSDLATEEPRETPAADPKALAREYEEGEIPSNVLFWGDQSQPSASSTIRAPFQVTIDIPRLSQRDALHPASVMSPMARASASFRRLLSRGKSVVSPHDDDDGLDEGGPSSHSPRTPPPPSPPGAS